MGCGILISSKERSETHDGCSHYSNRKFFGRTKFFYNQTVDIDNYGSIDEAVRTVIANGLEKEAHGKVIDEKWKKWDEKT